MSTTPTQQPSGTRTTTSSDPQAAPQEPTTSDAAPDEPGVRTRLWRNGELVQQGFAFEDISEHLSNPDTLVWADLCDPDHHLLKRLAEELDLDRHAVEDAVSFGERPKATKHPHHTFVVTYATMLDSYNAEGESDYDSRLRLTKVSAFVMPHGVVTVRSNARFDIEDVVQHWEDDADLLRLGPAALVHGLLDSVVDGHFDTVQQLDEAIEGLEDDLFDEGSRSRHLVQRETFRLRKELVELRRVVLPMREVVGTIIRHRDQLREAYRAEAPSQQAAAGPNELRGYYDDLYDHVLRAAEWTESLRDMISSIFETSLSLQDARLNTIMKKLTAWAAIIAIPTAITGWFGMNVPYPGFGHTVGVWLATGAILIVAALLYVTFKRKDWL